MWTWFYRLASPPYVYRVAAAFAPWLLLGAAVLIGSAVAIVNFFYHTGGTVHA